MVGQQRALRHLLGNEPLSGEDALTWGLVAEVVETDEDVVTRTDEIAARLATLSPSALAAAKRMVKGSWSTTREENAVEEADTIAHQLGTPEAQAAIAAIRPRLTGSAHEHRSGQPRGQHVRHRRGARHVPCWSPRHPTSASAPTAGCPAAPRSTGSWGSTRVEGDVLRFGALATTMMAGPPEHMDQEQRVLTALGQPLRVEAGDDGVVLLVSDDGVVVLRPQPPTAVVEA